MQNSKKNVPNDVRRTMTNLMRIHRNEAEQKDFFNKCFDKFDKATEFVHKTKEMINTQSIFGNQHKVLDQLVANIQSCTACIEWKSVNAGSVDLPILNSNSAKKNRKKLNKWLQVNRPTKSLSRYFAYEDKIKSEIIELEQSIKTGIANIITMCNYLNNDFNIISLFSNPNRFNPHDLNILIDLYIKRLNENDNCIINMLTNFNIAERNLQSTVDAWNNFIKECHEQIIKDDAMLMTLNELIEWRKDKEAKVEAEELAAMESYHLK